MAKYVRCECMWSADHPDERVIRAQDCPVHPDPDQ
jgi:hypothetical protein